MVDEQEHGQQTGYKLSPIQFVDMRGYKYNYLARNVSTLAFIPILAIAGKIVTHAAPDLLFRDRRVISSYYPTALLPK
ncbi:hypothetical protein SERLADRAFT_399622 [Serpula lacrymans var. lacrymans S7.9]|uniref:Uncharacterized protein n=1 Tax=Serpula lacrymans var. lacrymans (strain S7.9) TaxID=578457 RepID=F8P841_SERL9|nr:uncharacterized protein SERLADRAFT_399622 [Serpula lacrymans var. lacrymans S7.9]EGO20599.1 hypothetical protein SERLADRAFT_399622 [Serpula lacrymans var. lacrymans S7.9]